MWVLQQYFAIRSSDTDTNGISPEKIIKNRASYTAQMGKRNMAQVTNNPVGFLYRLDSMNPAMLKQSHLPLRKKSLLGDLGIFVAMSPFLICGPQEP